MLDHLLHDRRIADDRAHTLAAPDPCSILRREPRSYWKFANSMRSKCPSARRMACAFRGRGLRRATATEGRSCPDG